QREAHPEVHRIADPAIETAHDETPRRIERRGRAAARPRKVPHAAQHDQRADREERERDRIRVRLEGNALRLREPAWKKPHPNRDEERGDDGGTEDGEEAHRLLGAWAHSSMSL